MHPADEEDADDDNVEDVDGDPHDEAAKLLVEGGGNTPDVRSGEIGSIQRREKGEAGTESNGGHAIEKDVEYLAAEREAWETLFEWTEDGPPVEEAKDDEGDMLKDVDTFVL